MAHYIEPAPTGNYKWATYKVANGPKGGPNRKPYSIHYQQNGYSWKEKIPCEVQNEWQHNVQRQIEWTADCLDKLDAQARLTEIEIINSADDPSPSILPIGGILVWALEDVPAGFLRCQGQLVSRSTYPELFATLGTKYGSTNDSNFQLPDYRGYFLRGTDRDRGLDPDNEREVGSVQDMNFKSHRHTSFMDNKVFLGGTRSTKNRNLHAHDWDTTYDIYTNKKLVDEAEGGETRPANITVDYIIKAKAVH